MGLFSFEHDDGANKVRFIDEFNTGRRMAKDRNKNDLGAKWEKSPCV